MSDDLDYDSRCRWLGPTPEMLLWWVKGNCPPLTTFAQAFPYPQEATQAHQVLRPLQEVQIAQLQHRRDQDLVYLLPEDTRTMGATRRSVLAFFVEEHTQSFGGLRYVQQSCQGCPCNTENTVSGEMAGCIGAVVAGSLDSLQTHTRTQQAADWPLPVPPWTDQPNVPDSLIQLAGELLEDPSSDSNVWYRLLECISSPPWPDNLVRSCRHWLVDHPETETHHDSARSLVRAITTAAAGGFPLRQERIPRGFSDGHDWWLGPHCSRCGGPMISDQPACPHCGHDRHAVATSRRRVMGWHPYRPLTSLVGKSEAQTLVHRWRTDPD